MRVVWHRRLTSCYCNFRWNKLNWATYLNVPEAFPGPRLSENLTESSLAESEDFLRVPFKMFHDIRVLEVVLYPVPQWATPGVKGEGLVLVFLDDLVALKLSIGG
jgi:hypothetical protein